MNDHVHNHAMPVGSKLKYGLLLTIAILVIELIGGLVSNSLALLSDAGHVFADVIALSLSCWAVRQAERPASRRMTFGYHRVGVLIAVVNAVSILIIALVIFYEAYRRFLEPQEVNSLLMLGVAAIGLAVNLFVANWLRKEQRNNINVRSAFWHVLGDALASVGVIVGGIIIYFTDLFVVDVIISVFIGLVILLAAWRIFKEGLEVLLEAAPSQVDVHKMIGALKKVPGVKGVHDIHVWSISPEIHAMSTHVLIDDCTTSQATVIRQRVEEVLKRYNIEHTTLQMECELCSKDDIFCKLTAIPEKDTGETPPAGEAEGHEH